MRFRPLWALESALGAALLVGLLALVALYASAVAAPATEDKIVFFFLNLVLVVGLQMFSGNSGILSFGHLAFAGAGAYLAAALTMPPGNLPGQKGALMPGLPDFMDKWQLSFVPALLIVAAVVAVLALAAGLPVLRLDGASAVIAILALLLIGNVVFNGWTKITNGAGGLYGLPQDTNLWRAFVCTAIVVVIARLFKDSRTGMMLQGSREDAFSAASVGVRVRAMRLRSWVVSCAAAGVGGALYALYVTTITPQDFYLAHTFTIVVMLIVGGMATVSGAVLGAGVVTLVQESVKPYEEKSLDVWFVHINRLTSLSQIALVALILLVMYFRREGLVGRREFDEAIRRWAWPRVTRRSS